MKNAHLVLLIGIYLALQVVLIAGFSEMALNPLSGFASVQQGQVRVCINSLAAVQQVQDIVANVSSPLNLQINVSNADNDTLRYRTNSTLFTINPTTGAINFTPVSSQAGNYSILVNVTEVPRCGRNISHIMMFNLSIPAVVVPPVFSPGGASGGSTCVEQWTCQPFGRCIAGVQERYCFDQSQCGTSDYRPLVSQPCIGGALWTCYDGVQSTGEEGVDCGGPCPPCPTCRDGIENQDEVGIDCGGQYCSPCVRSPTCFDLAKNQGEEGIDCGGPCRACLAPVLEVPRAQIRGFCVGKMYVTCLSSTSTLVALAFAGIILLQVTRPRRRY